MSELKEKQTDVDKTNKKQTLTVLRKRWRLFAKILELVLCVLCAALVIQPEKRSDLPKIQLQHFALICTTFIGFALITSIYIVARIIGDRLPYRTGFIFSMLASCLFFVSGILLAIDVQRKYFYDQPSYDPRQYLLNLLAASSALSFLTSLVFAFEAMYIFKFQEDF